MIKFLPEIGLRSYIDDELIHLGFSYDDSLSINDNLKTVFALQRRIPNDNKRTVIELPRIQLPEGMEIAYESIKRKLIHGISIKPYLSLSTSKYTYNDLLLNSWNIHHLHLSEEPYKNGFFKRTGPVLFCMFYETVVIFIDILNHGNGHADVWVNEELIKKLHRYFPESIARFRVNRLQGHNLSPAQRLALRKNHYNYAMPMEDGTVYQLLGIMSNGDSFNDVHRMMLIQRAIDYFAKLIEVDEKVITNSLNMEPSQDLTLTAVFHENEIKLYAIEKKTIINITSV